MPRSRKLPAKVTKLQVSKRSKYPSKVTGGFTMSAICSFITRSVTSGSTKRWLSKNSSGCCAFRLYFSNSSPGKSFMFSVMITSQRPNIAAATICLSSSSGKAIPATRDSYPWMLASGKACAIQDSMASTFVSSWIFLSNCWRNSRRISALQCALKVSFSDKRNIRSLKCDEYSTFVSVNTENLAMRALFESIFFR